MTVPEFRRQVLRTRAQWDLGSSYGLRSLDEGGFALLPRATFLDWATQSDAARCVGSFAVDHCQRIFWVHRHDGRLYRFDPTSGLAEATIALGEPGRGSVHVFGRVLAAGRRLWVLDRTRSRIIALRPDTFQIVAEIELEGPIDVAFGAHRIFSLDRNGIQAHDEAGRRLEITPTEGLGRPLALGADGTGRTYVLDSRRRTVLRFTIDGKPDGEVGNLDEVSTAFRPWLLAVGPQGNCYASDGSPVAHEFAPDGPYVGRVGEGSPLTGIQGMTLDSHGRLYVGSPSGIARFASDGGVAEGHGTFYSATLDNGLEGRGGWHRLDLVTDIDGGGAIDVYYASAGEEESLARAVASILARAVPAAEKAKALEAVLADRWKGPEELRGPSTDDLTANPEPERGRFRRGASHSILFSTDTGRYLWLKLVVSGLAPRATAAVREMRVYYPRLSYLRYLPAVYQEDPASREFLERFLSMFETVFGGLEATIDRIPEAFDPKVTPPEFLEWLAQWLDIGVEEDWPDGVKRQLIVQASALYQRKGTPSGLADFIEIVTGTRPTVREAFEADRPFVLGDTSRLGLDVRLSGRPLADLRRDEITVLGRSSVLGATQLRATARVPTDPFRDAAHRVTLLLALSRQEYRRHQRGLARIIRDYVPAHVDCDVRLVSGIGLGPDLVVGLNARVEDPQPFRLGHSLLGRATCARGAWYGPEVGIDALVTASVRRPASLSPCFEGEP